MDGKNVRSCAVLVRMRSVSGDMLCYQVLYGDKSWHVQNLERTIIDKDVVCVVQFRP